MQIKYEAHPVSAARKAELRAQGFKIIDARFAPDAPPEAPSRADVAKMPKADVVGYLEAHGVDKAEMKGAKVADLRKSLLTIMFAEI